MNHGDDADSADRTDVIFDRNGNPMVSSSLVKADIAALSNRGKVMPVNTDHYIVGRADRVLQPLLTNMPAEMAPVRFGETVYGMLVADGFGAMETGALASSLALDMFTDLLLAAPYWIMKPDEQEKQKLMQRMADRFRRVHMGIIDETRRHPSLSGMGTTLTLACSLGRDFLIAHVGDSRVYLFRQGKLRQLTHDHTLAQKLVDEGIIQPGEMASHYSRYSLTNALGATGVVECESRLAKLMDGDVVLLCTNGLNEMVDDVTIEEILSLVESPSEACQALVDKAMERGGIDDVTAIVARYSIPDIVDT